MHPSLAEHLHSSPCNDLIKALAKCHEDNPKKQFLGVCTSVKASMDKCLKAEVSGVILKIKLNK